MFIYNYQTFLYLICNFILTLTTQPHQKIRFLEIFFRILNMFAIVSNLQKNNLIFVKTPKNNFSDPQATNHNKTRREYF